MIPWLISFAFFGASPISGFEPKKLSDQEINELVKEKPADPFDPEQFNNAAAPE